MPGHYLSVPGAKLYYKMQGSGPLLLMVQGGAADAEGFDPVVAHLVDRYTVITYDRRGLSRSKLDADAPPHTIATHGDDVHRILNALADSPTLVFGTSLGAIVALELTIRHPEQVRLLVAHEPPAPHILPELEQSLVGRMNDEIERTFDRSGAKAAMKKFLGAAGVRFDDMEPGAEATTRSREASGNAEFFLMRDTRAVRHYRLDLEALAATGVPVVPAVGRTSGGAWPHQSALAIARKLGVQPAEFPGAHNGHVTHPRSYAAVLRNLLDEAL